MVRPYIYLLVLAASFSSGWLVHGWKVDSENAASVLAIRQVQSSISAELENSIAEIREKERVIYREVPKYIDRPVYINECIDADGMRDINASKGGTAKPAG